MLRIMLVASLMSLSIAGCKKDSATGGAPAATATAKGTVGADGIRHIPIEAGQEGYKPDKIAGKPGEKLVLVFTRTVDAECISQLKTPDGTLVDLPKDKPVDVAITVPATGQLTFACGMDMFHGTIVADDKS